MKLKDWHQQRLARDPEYAKALEEIAYAQRIADFVVSERVRLGLTQEQLAERAGTNQAHVSEIETGVGNPTLNTVEHILAALRAAAVEANQAASVLAVQGMALGFFAGGVNATLSVGTAGGFWAINATSVQMFPGQAVITTTSEQTPADFRSRLALAA